MVINYIFDSPRHSGEAPAPNMWVMGSAVILVGYMLFGLVLVGVPQFSRGGIAFALLGFVWLTMAVLTRNMVFPKVLWLPTLFYAMILLSGLMMPKYPVEYAGMITTIWLGSIVLAAFVGNGVSIYLVIAGFVVVFVANVVAIVIGYDGYVVNQTTSSLQYDTVIRKSGLAGQPNLLVALTFTLPFLFFLLRKTPGLAVYAVGVAACFSMMVVTGSRSTVAFTALYCVFGALFLIKSVLLRLVIGFVSVVLLTINYSLISDPYIISKLEQSPLAEVTVVKRVIGGIDRNQGSSQEIRAELATQFWPKFYEKPVFGYGPQQFQKVAGEGYYAHNNFAEIAINWGVLGLLLYYSLYAIALYGIIKYLQTDYRMITTLLFLATSDFVFVTFLERPMVLCMCLLLVTVYHNRPHRSRRRRRRHSYSSAREEEIAAQRKPLREINLDEIELGEEKTRALQN